MMKRNCFSDMMLPVCSLSDEEYSDDEDVSWKVRRAAAKCLQAIIESYPDLLKDIYQKAATALIGRFKEREENVKSDIFQTFVELVKQIGSTANRYEGADMPPIELLRRDVPSIVKAAVRQLKEKSVRTKQGVFAALQELVTVVPDVIGVHTSQMMPGILSALNVSLPHACHADTHCTGCTTLLLTWALCAVQALLGMPCHVKVSATLHSQPVRCTVNLNSPVDAWHGRFKQISEHL